MKPMIKALVLVLLCTLLLPHTTEAVSHESSTINDYEICGNSNDDSIYRIPMPNEDWNLPGWTVFNNRIENTDNISTLSTSGVRFQADNGFYYLTGSSVITTGQVTVPV